MRDRELRGVVASTKRFILTPEQIESFKNRARHVFDAGSPDVLFTAIDPSGGGASSDYTIVTIAFVNAQPVVSLRCGDYDLTSG